MPVTFGSQDGQQSSPLWQEEQVASAKFLPNSLCQSSELPFSSYWPEVGHMITISCKGDWEVEYLAKRKQTCLDCLSQIMIHCPRAECVAFSSKIWLVLAWKRG